jgi:DNA-binding transcriptional ArsR family regulator
MYRKLAAEELAKFLSLISHPERIRIIEELNHGELDVTGIQERLEITQSTTSRHLSLLKAQGIVVERKEGRRVYYHLSVPPLASWLVAGLDIIGKKSVQKEVPLSKAFAAAKKLWASQEKAGR